MSCSDQLNLFDLLDKPSAEVVLFPLHRRANFVRAAARKILAMRSRSRSQKYWTNLIAQLRRELVAAGSPAPAIERDLQQFWSAVKREIEGASADRSERSAR